jgi:hypothetical protein
MEEKQVKFVIKVCLQEQHIIDLMWSLEVCYSLFLTYESKPKTGDPITPILQSNHVCIHLMTQQNQDSYPVNSLFYTAYPKIK